MWFYAVKTFVSLYFLSSKKRHNNAFIASLLWCDNTTYILQRWGEGEKNICSASQSTFLVPASDPADRKWSPDSASYHGIKKASKQAWHKKLITTLVFQVTTSGSLPNFAGWSQVSHKINTGRVQPRQLHLSSAAAPDAPGPRALAGSCLHLRPPGCARMPSRLVGLWESQTAYLALWWGRNRRPCPCRDTFSSPPFPGLEQAGAGRSEPAGRRRRRGTEPWQEQVWAGHQPCRGVRPAQPARPTRR